MHSLSEFSPAIHRVLSNEGFYSNDKVDPGGATKYGISLRWLKSQGLIGDFDNDGDVDIDDIKIMTMDQAIKLYHDAWWNKYGYQRIESQIVATKVLDISINMGATQAHKCIQRATRSLYRTISDDGVLGNISIRTINGLDTVSLMAAFRSETAGVYRQIVAIHPEMIKYQNGWLNRAYQ